MLHNSNIYTNSGHIEQGGVFDVSCPPWALPREEIPLHVKINKEITPLIKNSKIHIPSSLKLLDMINVTSFKKESNKLVISGVGKAKKSSYDYFGIVIATKDLIAELKKEIPINIEFEYHDGTKKQIIKNARIFRPRLDLTSIPNDIILSDKDKASPIIPISLKFTGFGEINIRIECKIEGKIVSVGTSMLDEILHLILNNGFISMPEDNNTGITVDPNYVENIVKQLKEKFKTDLEIQKMMRTQQINDETIKILYELTKEEKEKMMETLFKTVEGYLTKIILDILGRQLSDNLQIDSQTKIHTQIKLPTTDVVIKLFYNDLLNNEYEPIKKVIQINDKRKNPAGFNVEIPLEINSIDESKAYKNVGNMAIDSS